MVNWIKKKTGLDNDGVEKLDIFDKIRRFSLGTAEIFDAFRIVPRLLIAGWAIVVYIILNWYVSIETFTKHVCNESILKYLMEKGVSLDQAVSVACTTDAVIGGPSTVHTTILSLVVSIAGVVFGFYVNSGRNWRDAPFLPWNWFNKHSEQLPREGATDEVATFSDPQLYRLNETETATQEYPNFTYSPTSTATAGSHANYHKSVGVRVPEDEGDSALSTTSRLVANTDNKTKPT